MTAQEPVSPARPSAGSGRREAAVLLVLVAVGAVLPLVVSLAAGSADIPRNDDWSYRRIATELARSGQVELNGATMMMLIGQLLVVQPLLWLFEPDGGAFIVAGFAFAVSAVVAAYAMARQVVSPARAAVATGSLLLFPGYLAYATSFMSDVPAVAAQWACLALGAYAMRRRPIPTGVLTLAVVVGCIAVSIREFSLAAPVAVLVALACAEPRRPRTWVLVGATAMCVLGLVAWRAGLPGQIGEPDLPDTMAGRVPLAVSSVAFVTLPVFLLVLGWRQEGARRAGLVAGGLLGLLVLLPRLLDGIARLDVPDGILANLTTRWGVPGPNYVLGGRPLLFPERAWALVDAAGLAATIVMTAALGGLVAALVGRPRRDRLRSGVRGLGSASGLLLLYILLVGGGLAVFALRFPIFDRYLWAIVPPLVTLVLSRVPSPRSEAQPGFPSRRVSLGGAAVAAAGLAFLAGVLMLNSHAFDAARWRAGTQLADMGFAADEIDAGYEWMGFHATTPAYAANPVRDLNWYRAWWPEFRMCAFVSSVPTTLPDARLVGQAEYRLWLLAGPIVPLYLYRVDRPDCPTPGDP